MIGSQIPEAYIKGIYYHLKSIIIINTIFLKSYDYKLYIYRKLITDIKLLNEVFEIEMEIGISQFNIKLNGFAI